MSILKNLVALHPCSWVEMKSCRGAIHCARIPGRRIGDRYHALLNELILDYSVGLDLYQPVRVDEACNLHYRVRRPDLCKEFAMYLAHALPIFYACKQY